MKKTPFGLDEPTIYPALVWGAIIGVVVPIMEGRPYRAIGGAIGGAFFMGILYLIVGYIRRR
jgi:glucose uptake protein GlcU